MTEQSAEQRLKKVAACTAAAAHRRDHHHGALASECHPHAVEVVRLGHRAVTVCHDCHSDSGFIGQRDAEAVARRHRDDTQSATVPLSAAVA